MEWWIYIAFGCLIAVFGRYTKRRVVAVVAGLFALASVIGTALSGSMLISAWMIGAALAWWAPLLSHRSWAAVGGVSAAALIGFLVLEPGSVYSFPVVAATSLAILAAFRASPWVALAPFARPIRFLADYSYSLYLIHFSVLVWFAALAPGVKGWAFVFAGFAIGNAAAIACWFLFERHFPKVRTLLDRKVRHPRADVEAAGGAHRSE